MSDRRHMVVDTEGMIGFLQDNLRDRYKDCFSIVQELLQNADDAKAKHVHFGMFNGIPGTSALLNGPALLVVNDGPVSPSDLDAIYRIAAGNKRADEDKIGKFGLGMKSVFHVCEAFFMFGKNLEVQAELPDFCTPWSEEYHQEWWNSWERESNTAAEAVEKIIGPIVEKWPRWFCVWIPMRNQVQLGGISPILKMTPDDETYEKLTGVASSEKAARMIPLLKNVEELSFGDLNGERRTYTLKSNGRLFPQSCSLSGEVIAEGQGASGFSYFGEARLHDGEQAFTELQDLECWPESTHKESLRKAETITDKTKPHAAVCIMTEESDSPRVSVVPCVFLPLSGAYERDDRHAVASTGRLSVRICLHGSMFVDAGRQDFNIGRVLSRLPQDDGELRGEWNRRLFFDAVLPLLIPQVEKLLSGQKEDEAMAIMSGLSRIGYLSERLPQVCRDSFLVHKLTPTGYSWHVVPSADTIISLDRPRSPLIRKVLCESLPEGVHVIDSEAGRLARRDAVRESLPPEIRLSVLRTIARMSPEDSDNEILLRFARDCASGLKFSELDDELRRAPIWKVGNSRLSYEELKEKTDGLRIYCDATTGLKQKLLSAVEWTLESAPRELGDALGLRFRKLDVDFVIDILHEVPKLGEVGSRRELLAELKMGVALDADRRRRAVRYLVHGSRELFDNTAKLYTPDASLPSDFAEVVLKAISAALYSHSYSIPVDMLAALSDADQEEYGFGRLTRDSVAVVLADTPGISYAGFPADSWQTLLRVSDRLFTDYAIKSALKRIQIFPFEDGGRGALSESCFYEHGVKIPSVFRNKVHILSVPKDADLARRLEELVQSWRYSDTFRFCRESSLAVEQLSVVLTDAVTRTPSLTGDDRAYLEKTKWVPKIDGGYCSPNSIINVPDFVPPEGVTEMVPSCAFDEHTLKTLRNRSLLPEDRVCVQTLFEDLAKNPRYHLGLIKLPDGVPLTCDSIFSIFQNQDVLPVVAVLKGLVHAKSACDDCIRRLVGPVDPDLLPGIVTELTMRIHETRELRDRQILWAALCSYLEELSNYDDEAFSSVLEECEFLDAKLSPRNASELCTGGEGIPSEYVLHEGYRGAKNFFDRLDESVVALTSALFERSAEYKDYFSKWDSSFDAQIGGFIVCTSDRAADIELVKRKYWPDGRSIADNRNKLFGGCSEALKGLGINLKIQLGETVAIRSLTGTLINVPMRALSEVDNLLVGNGCPVSVIPDPHTWMTIYRDRDILKQLTLRMRYVSENELEQYAHKLDALLKNTLAIVGSRLAGPLACDIENFWGGLSSVEQLSLTVTRAVLLNHASYYLGMLGCQDEKLEQYFTDQKELETVIEDARTSKGGGCQQYLAKKDALARDLGRLIETDAGVARHILEALRHEMRNRYEYNETSILYELFQNADDASEQLYAISSDKTTENGRFEVKYDGETLIVAHWGRVINSVASASGAGLAHREFKRDLENMLMLMQSGKKNAKISVTGKFGLGFKTVFFVCDEPIVYSGGLRFKINGGFLPQPLPDEDNEKYALMVRRFAEEIPGSKPTVFILPIVPQQRAMMERCVEKFSENVQTVCTLAKRIGRVRVTTPSGGVKDVHNVAFDGALSAEGDRFVIDLDDGSLFFGNKNGIPVPLPDEEATYWATVPTKLCLRMGFALNGGLDLTTGRAKINDSSTTNPKLIAKWSVRLFEALKKIDSDVRKLEDGGYAFLAALWDLFTVRREVSRWENPETNLLRDLLWDERSGGYRRYLCSGRSIPSGLTGRLRVLCSPMAVSYVVSREVANHELLSLLERGALIPGCAVSEEVFVAPAKRFFKDVHGLTKYGMLEFLTDLQNERPVLDWKWCSSEAGRRLLQALKDCELDHEAQLQLRNFMFMTNGSATNKAENLVGADGYDEKRMSFVPADYQLSSNYDEIGITLFKLIRGERRIQTEELARLAARAATLDEQAAVLRYVMETRDIDFTEAFKACNVTWMKDVTSHPYFIGLDENSQMVLAGMLGLGLESISDDGQEDFFPPQPEIDIRTLDWSVVASWWSANSDTYLRRYNELIYDRTTVDPLPRDLESNPTARSEWLEVFVLSAAFNLGMRDCQHKGFIRMLKNTRMDSRTLWEVYCDKALKPKDWMDTLEYFVQQEEFKRQYRYWMGLFMRIYQFASHLEGYVQFVRMFNQLREVRSLESIMAIRTNPELNGSGIDLPGLQRALCERGQSFLVRELVRRNVVTNQRLHPYCFVRNPTLFGGKDSKSIYNSVAFNLHGGDPTFGGAFDIALASYLREERKADVLYVF